MEKENNKTTLSKSKGKKKKQKFFPFLKEKYNGRAMGNLYLQLAMAYLIQLFDISESTIVPPTHFKLKGLTVGLVEEANEEYPLNSNSFYKYLFNPKQWIPEIEIDIMLKGVKVSRIRELLDNYENVRLFSQNPLPDVEEVDLIGEIKVNCFNSFKEQQVKKYYHFMQFINACRKSPTIQNKFGFFGDSPKLLLIVTNADYQKIVELSNKIYDEDKGYKSENDPTIKNKLHLSDNENMPLLTSNTMFSFLKYLEAGDIIILFVYIPQLYFNESVTTYNQCLSEQYSMAFKEEITNQKNTITKLKEKNQKQERKIIELEQEVNELKEMIKKVMSLQKS